MTVLHKKKFCYLVKVLKMTPALSASFKVLGYMSVLCFISKVP